MPKIRYVVGFYFNNNMDKVVLIEKKKPKWQEGLLNGVGGKVEDREFGYEAMQREFKEECGVNVLGWEEMGEMSGGDWECEVFYYREEDDIKFNSVRSMEEEKILIVDVDDFNGFETISNLHWLIPMCIDREMFENGEYAFYGTFE